MQTYDRPRWLVKQIPNKETYDLMQTMVEDLKLHTVCQEANCPNLGECFKNRTATFMIMGDICSRSCKFCAVNKGIPSLLDPLEPKHVAEAVNKLMLKHAVITSVTRDDLIDNGAAHYAETIRYIKKMNKNTTVEVLIPDLQGNYDDLKFILDAKPEILNHNVETVPRLYSKVRPTADFDRSLSILKQTKAYDNKIFTKTGIMVGLGETTSEVIEVMERLVDLHCDILTIGQYLQPSIQQLNVHEYIKPEQFEAYKIIGQELGIPYVESGPFVRSSYNAIKALNALNNI